MTFLGAIGHALPFLIPVFSIAVFIAIIVVAIELVVIAYVRHKYLETPFVSATLQIIVGGVIVLAAGILIGRS